MTHVRVRTAAMAMAALPIQFRSDNDLFRSIDAKGLKSGGRFGTSGSLSPSSFFTP